MSTIGDPTGKLDIGRVIQQLFAALSRNFATFAILAVILVGVPTAIVYGFQPNVTATSAAAFNFGPRLAYSIVSGIVAGLSGLILQGTIIYGTVSDLNGKPVSVADSLRIGLYTFLPLLGIGILMGLAIGIGMILLIVPGIILAIVWCVAIPAYVVERPSLMDVFGRSAALTRNNRWRIFGLMIVFFIAVLIIELVLGIVGGVTNLISFGGLPVVTRFVILPLINVASALIGATGGAVLYVELRRLRDGVGPQGLAAIFD
ncbi:MAG TPA: hypothetical protein VHW05_05905 [Phenylobacterium sp.]|jgi:hypothetical protein|nr:hypothetical protein [Phenylobacterium sp.]